MPSQSPPHKMHATNLITSIVCYKTHFFPVSGTMTHRSLKEESSPSGSLWNSQTKPLTIISPKKLKKVNQGNTSYYSNNNNNSQSSGSNNSIRLSTIVQPPEAFIKEKLKIPSPIRKQLPNNIILKQGSHTQKTPQKSINQSPQSHTQQLNKLYTQEKEKKKSSEIEMLLSDYVAQQDANSRKPRSRNNSFFNNFILPQNNNHFQSGNAYDPSDIFLPHQQQQQQLLLQKQQQQQQQQYDLQQKQLQQQEFLSNQEMIERQCSPLITSPPEKSKQRFVSPTLTSIRERREQLIRDSEEIAQMYSFCYGGNSSSPQKNSQSSMSSNNKYTPSADSINHPSADLKRFKTTLNGRNFNFKIVSEVPQETLASPFQQEDDGAGNSTNGLTTRIFLKNKKKNSLFPQIQKPPIHTDRWK